MKKDCCPKGMDPLMRQRAQPDALLKSPTYKKKK